MNYENIYVADFETTTSEPTSVWLWGLNRLDGDHYEHGDSINQFIDYFIKLRKDIRIYFHNLKFDGSFIVSYLLNNGFIYSENEEPNTFDTLITDMNLWYQITIRAEYTTQKRQKKLFKIKIFDSLKIIPLKIADMPKTFGLPLEKLEMKYDEKKSGTKANEKDLEYQFNDVEILRLSLKFMFDRGIDRMTMSSAAMADLIAEVGEGRFKKLFPVISTNEIFRTDIKGLCDEELRELCADKKLRLAYRGGWTYLKKGLENQILKNITVYDVNSLYPFIMRERVLPYGAPIINQSMDDIENFPLKIIFFSCSFELKEDYLPTIQIKNNLLFNGRDYLESSNQEVVYLSFTNVDFDLFLKHYNVYDIYIEQVYHFRGIKGLFNDYIDKWNEVKERNEKNPGVRFIAKRMNNGVYGKFATNPVRRKREPQLHNGILKFKTLDGEYEPTYYLPVGIFVTSYAREYTIQYAQNHYDDFVYADTDSLHLKNKYDDIPLHQTRLGAFKIEKEFDRARYIRAKRYIGEKNNELIITCAGLPSSCYDQVTFDNFVTGTQYTGKLLQKQVVGGVILEETTFNLQ